MQAHQTYLTPKEIAETLKISVRTVQRYVTTSDGEPSRIRAIQVGPKGLYRISTSEFDRWLGYQRDNAHHHAAESSG